jgi:peptidyl-prolyl cis-trans isomerase SurA
MTLRIFRNPAASVFGTMLLASSLLAHSQASAPQSPYGGTTVEDIVARVNAQIITSSDYDRALKEMDAEGQQHAATRQELAAGHNDLLRNLIDQQLWLSKGKELGVTGETQLVKRLDEIRKQYHMDSLEDLEKAAKDQGVSFEDFKANIRNGIITQEVMSQEVGRRLQFTPGEVERYYGLHKQEYSQPESEHLDEILVSDAAPASTTGPAPADDAKKQAAAKVKADDIEARLHAGGDFGQLARSFSDGPTAAQGGDLGQYNLGQLPKALEDKTFPLKEGQVTDPILTRQGYVILKVVQHIPGGPAPYNDVKEQVEQALYMSKMEPAIRDYLTKMREDAFIDIKPGYTDSGASPNETKPVYSAYTPPATKKKKKIERTRFRETTHTFRQKSPQAAAAPEPAPAPAPAAAKAPKKKKDTKTDVATMKPGKKEKIRYGQAPRETLPAGASTPVENAGALPEVAANNGPEPVNPLVAAAPEKKTRFSAHLKEPKQAKPKGPQLDSLAPPPPDAAEVADPRLIR